MPSLDLATKENTLTNATANLEHAKGKDAEKAEQLRLLDEAKTQAEDEEAKTKRAETKAQGGANLASTKLQETTADEKEAKIALLHLRTVCQVLQKSVTMLKLT